uniref:Sushi domain-containing protein n=1 Tax=Salvator merianae TaxID=96440 RepID=A0A8D0DIW4_SALMN
MVHAPKVKRVYFHTRFASKSVRYPVRSTTLHLTQFHSNFPLSIGSCGPPKRLEFLAKEYKETDTFAIGSTVKFICLPGYIKHPRLSASLTCVRNQEWSEIQEFCRSEFLNINVLVITS